MNTLTPEQKTALKEYAAANGRTWKSKLRKDWMTGRAEGHLQQIRNTFGPSWLNKLKLSSL